MFLVVQGPSVGRGHKRKTSNVGPLLSNVNVSAQVELEKERKHRDLQPITSQKSFPDANATTI
jgi:hypothetical protein